LGAMTILDSLFSTAFLILVAASVAVVGSMIVLALFDLAFRRKKKPLVDTEADGEPPQADPSAVESEGRWNSTTGAFT
jgi:hypothetical protein